MQLRVRCKMNFREWWAATSNEGSFKDGCTLANLTSIAEEAWNAGWSCRDNRHWPEGLTGFERLRKAAEELYKAAYWFPDRPVNLAERLWKELRDAAMIEASGSAKASGLEDLVRAKVEGLYGWVDAGDRLPKACTPIEMTGPSGYVAPNDRRVESGYYYTGCADPWRTWAGDGLNDSGPAPTHWRYLTPGPPPPKPKQLYKVGDLLELQSGARLFVSKVTVNKFKDFVYSLSGNAGGIPTLHLMQCDVAIVGKAKR